MIYLLLAMTVTGFAWCGVEFARHIRRRRRIALRIHVNGTRGKSSVCRLIGAGLRAAGRRTIVKTTGSAARIIHEDGSEQPVRRGVRPRILEQLDLFRRAAARGADAVVLECMALQPRLQELCERKIVRAHVAVITNVRADHLDAMGPTVEDVALALSGVIPAGGVLVARSSRYDAFFARACGQVACRLVLVGPAEVAQIDEAQLARFAHIEHAENVALALAACQAAGVDRRTALEGMFAAEADVGALRLASGELPAGRWTFADAFAANDPESSVLLWQLLCGRLGPADRRIVVVNCRADRLDRSRQLGEMMARQVTADAYVLVGQETRVAIRAARAGGVPAERIVNLQDAPAAEVLSRLRGLVSGPTLIVGMGNIKGTGEALSQYIRREGLGHD